MVEDHNHEGTSGRQLDAKFALLRVPQEALTPKSTATLSTGGSNDLKTSDSQIIQNLRTRLDELEEKLQNIGLLK